MYEVAPIAENSTQDPTPSKIKSQSAAKQSLVGSKDEDYSEFIGNFFGESDPEGVSNGGSALPQSKNFAKTKVEKDNVSSNKEAKHMTFKDNASKEEKTLKQNTPKEKTPKGTKPGSTGISQLSKAPTKDTESAVSAATSTKKDKQKSVQTNTPKYHTAVRPWTRSWCKCHLLLALLVPQRPNLNYL